MENQIKNICVFCGSSLGTEPKYGKLAYELGKLLAERQITLVFGGSKVGLMGQVAQGVLDHKGHVKGVIPDFLARKEVAHDGIQELIVVKTMHERKMMMSSLADGFIALPGGFGTLEELFEILTWAQLQLIKAPVGVLNWEGYYDHLADQMKRMVKDGLLKKDNCELLLQSESAVEMLEKMNRYEEPTESFWAKLNLT